MLSDQSTSTNLIIFNKLITFIVFQNISKSLVSLFGFLKWGKNTSKTSKNLRKFRFKLRNNMPAEKKDKINPAKHDPCSAHCIFCGSIRVTHYSAKQSTGLSLSWSSFLKTPPGFTFVLAPWRHFRSFEERADHLTRRQIQISWLLNFGVWDIFNPDKK